MSQVDVAMLVLRLWAGVVMIAHGINHGRNIDGTASWFEKVGFRAPRVNAMMSAGNEIAIGLGLIVGFLTAPAAAALAATMLVAFWSIHRFAGFFVFHRPDEGYEYVATLTALAFTLAVVGPGSLSIDSALGLAENLDGWVGFWIFVAGLVAGVGQLAIFWRKPEGKEGE